MRELLIGVDIGTSESKGILCDVRGMVIACYSKAHDTQMPHPGWFEHDAEAVWWGDFVWIVKKLLSHTDAARIAGISVSGLGQDLLPVDKHVIPLRKNAILYGIDTRSFMQIDEMNRQLGEDRILKNSANALSTHSMGPKISWLKENERQVFDSADYFLTCSSYLTAKLTGEFTLDHHQASFWVPFYDIEHGCWNKEMCKEYLDVGKLPRLMWEYETAGEVTDRAARETGLLKGTPVCVGTGDAFAESISAGALEPGQVMGMYGSTTCIYMPVKSLHADGKLWSYRSYDKDKYGIAMCTSSSGSVTKWFRNCMAGEFEDLGDEAYSRLAEEAKNSPPGSGGVILLPYFTGERSPIYDANAKGIYYGLSLNTTRADLFRAALEGIAYSIRHNLEVLNEKGYKAAQIISVGGGVKNSVWMQAVSDACKVTQLVPRVTVGACYADAYIAGIGAGIFKNIEGIRNWISYDRTIVPQEENGEIYDRGYCIYRELYENTKFLIRRQSQ